MSWVSRRSVATTLRAGAGVGTHQSSGRAAKSRLAFRYHAIPDRGFFHLPCISREALLCVSSPLATISFRWLSCAFMTSFAVFPWCEKSHGPPNCLHVIVFISLASFHCPLSSAGRGARSDADLAITAPFEVRERERFWRGRQADRSGSLLGAPKGSLLRLPGRSVLLALAAPLFGLAASYARPRQTATSVVRAGLG